MIQPKFDFIVSVTIYQFGFNAKQQNQWGNVFFFPLTGMWSIYMMTWIRVEFEKN